MKTGDDTAHGAGTVACKLPMTESDGKAPILASDSAHELCLDSGIEAGFHLATAVDNAFILGYALLVMAFLGWAAGIVLFFVIGALALYCNIKLANLAIIDGKRFLRFRDISYAVYGSWAYWLTVVCQWLNITFGNIGLFILGGQALKGVHDLFEEKQNIKLSEWMIVTGGVAGIFTLAIPQLHNLRLWSAIACACTIAFVVIVIGCAAHDGNKWDEAENGQRSYAVFGSEDPQSYATMIFDAMGALSTLAFAFTTVITPEIQATVRNPPVKEFYKALAVTYGIGAPIFIILSCVGWWAYGDFVAPNLIDNLSGPKWAKTIAYLAVFIQCVVSFQVYASPIYETFDTKFGKGGVWSSHNIILRFLYRVPYVALTAFFAALLPFFGDFVALIGALSVLPLSFVLTLMMYVKVHRNSMSKVMVLVDYFLALIMFLVMIGSATASVRYIIVDATNYNVFANKEG